MTISRRIILNVLATYGRSAVTLFLGVFSSRWVLAALGQVDLGLFGVIGSVIFFITFLSAVLSQATSRFYAFSLGIGEKKNLDVAHDDLMRWFNTSFSMYVAIPVVMIVIGYPLCVYALNHWLVIPPERLETCVWVLRISFISSIVGMIATPYVAMFTAYQIITELVVFSLIQSVALFGCAYGLLYHSGDCLLFYSIAVSSITSIVFVMQILRARHLFAACRVVPSMLFDWNRLRKMFAFSGMMTIGGFAWMLRGNGLAMLLNMFYGPRSNAAMTIALNLSGHVGGFSSQLNNAMTPAIATAAGAGNLHGVQMLAYKCCKFGSLLVLLFGLPLIFEMDYVLLMWLKIVPAYSAELCVALIITFLVDYATAGHQIGILAHGKIVSWQIFDAVALVMTAPIGFVYMKLGCGIPSAGYAYVTTVCVMSVGRIYFARKNFGMSVLYWIRNIVLPLIIVVIPSCLVAFLLKRSMPSSLLRLLFVLSGTGIMTMIFSWLFVLNIDEKKYIMNRFQRVAQRLTSNVDTNILKERV